MDLANRFLDLDLESLDEPGWGMKDQQKLQVFFCHPNIQTMFFGGYDVL